jgi:hypothetical protein
VERFRNSAVAGNPELAKHTFIVGANGYGKTGNKPPRLSDDYPSTV